MISKRKAAMAAAISGLLGGVSVGLALLAMAEPGFYHRAVECAPEASARASDEFLAHVAALTSATQGSAPWQAIVTDQQINGWLAVDFPKHFAGLLPPGFEQPRVQIVGSDVRLACQYDSPFGKVVFVTSGEITLPEPNQLAIRISSARMGWLPMPVAGLLEQLSHVGDKQGWRVRWMQAGSDPVALVDLDLSAGAGKSYRIDTVSIRDNRIYIAGQTINRPAQLAERQPDPAPTDVEDATSSIAR